MTDFLGVKPVPGSVVREKVTIGTMPNGAPVELPVVIVSGDSPGPTIYVQAGVHGDEVTGVQLLVRLLAGLDVAQVAGTIVAVPLANPPAFLTRSRGFALEERGPFDLNRIFPGSPTGVLSERIVHAIFQEFVLQSDLTVDLHSALAGCDIAPFVYVDPDDDESGSLDLRLRLAKAVGTPYIYRKQRGSKLGTSVMTGAINTQADAHGKPLLAVEMGESHRISWQHMQAGVEGMRNLLREFGNLRERAVSHDDAVHFSRITLIHSPTGGLHESLVELGQRVTAGQELVLVTDPSSGESTVVTAPADGIVLRLMRTTPVGTGAELVWTVA